MQPSPGGVLDYLIILFLGIGPWIAVPYLIFEAFRKGQQE